LITVPSCEECREGWSKDDEYFCDVIVKGASAIANIGGEYVPSSTRKLLQQMEQDRLEAVARPEATGFLHKLASEMIDLKVITLEGIHLPHLSGFKPNHDRLNRVAERITRGLFFHEKDYPVPRDYRVDAAVRQFGSDPENDLQIYNLITSTPSSMGRTLEDKSFAYRAWIVEDDNVASLWSGVFHRSPMGFLGFIRPLAHISDD
jgi:hypothetical protein